MEQGNSLMKRVEPLSFSLGCLEGCDKKWESPSSTSLKTSPIATNSLNRRKVKVKVDRDGVRKSWGPSDKDEGNQEFWASIREPYDFIMGTHLIPDSYELGMKEELCSTATEMELSWDPEDVSPPYVWSFSEFLDQYNELYEWLIQVQLKLYSHSNPPDKQSRMAQQEELSRRTFRRKLFVEQGERVALKYPLEEEEIRWRVNYLNNKWEQLQSTLTPTKGRTEEVEVELDLAHEEDLLCNWLSAMEEQIQPITCRLPRGCSLHTLQERFKHNQILLKDIEAHGPILKSVIRQYERLASAETDPPNHTKAFPLASTPKDSPFTEAPFPNAAPLSNGAPLSVADTPLPKGKKGRTGGSSTANSVPRRAKSLERRWHQIYLRSLEWHYYLEGVITDFKEHEVSCSSDSEDEPVTKCRRLSFSSTSSASSRVCPSRRKPRPRGWSDYDNNSSEAGSYIEDDYVHMTDSESEGSTDCHGVKCVPSDGITTTDSSRPRSPMVGIDTMMSSPVEPKDKNCASSSLLLAASNENSNSSSSATMSPPHSTNDNNSPKNKNVRRHGSSQTACLTEVERPSPNSGVFDCKHYDTDSDNNNVEPKTSLREESTMVVEERKVVNVVRVHRKYHRMTSTIRRKMDFSCEEEVDPDALQEIIDSAIPDENWLNSNITTDSEEEESYIMEEQGTGEELVGTPPDLPQQQESMDTGSEENTPTKDTAKGARINHSPPPAKVSPKPCDKESIHRLISNVEQLVREPLKSSRSSLKPLSFGTPGETKRLRIKQWLTAQEEDSMALGVSYDNTNLQDSCDASGELTTGESENDIDSSDEDLDRSSATQKGSAEYILSSENTPTVEGLPSLSPDNVDKAVHRVKKGYLKEAKSCGGCDLRHLVGINSTLEPCTPPSSLETSKRTTPSSTGHSGQPSFESPPNPIHASSDETTTTKQRSDSMVSSDPCALSSTVGTDSNPPQSPTVTSSTAVPSTPLTTTTATSATVRSTDRVSPSLITSGSMRRRRIKFRRRSNQCLFRRTDSGSEELLTSKGARTKEGKWLSYSPYHHPMTKSLSSESESVSGCPRIVKSSSFSGGCMGENGTMTSSTEKCLSDSSRVSTQQQTIAEVPAPKCPPLETKVAPPFPSLSTDASPAISPRRGLMSDQENVHQEDVSSLSEQAWDPYQEFKYLSEPYSEDLDRDAARKLIEFGDDYRKYIDSDGSSFLGLPNRRRRSPHHRRIRPMHTYRSTYDSDSDLDDFHHVIEESKTQLSSMEGVLEKFSSQATLGLDLGELVATASTNVKCIHDILQHLQKETPELKSELSDVQSIVERWETLQAKAVERQRQSTQLRQLQRQVKTLRLSMEGVLGKCSAFAHPHTLDDPSQIGRKVAEAKALLDETENLRTDLSGLNVMVYRFTSEIGSTFTPLKDEMAELYRLWDETHRRVSEELSRLQSGEATWRLWEEQKAELSQALKQDSDTLKIIDAAIDNGRLTETVTASVHDVAKLLNERRLLPGGAKNKSQFSGGLSGTTEIDGKSHIEIEGKEDRLSDSGTSGYESCSSDDLSERERRLAYLRRLARDLEASLVPGSKAWNEISSTLAETEKELQGLQDHCRSLILRTAEALDDPSTKQPRFTSNGKRRSWTREGKSCRSPRVERRNRSTGPRREWIWRVVRAALPFQAALLLLLCVTCLLEPNCCDSVNTLNFNFTPQLRFVHGSPPL